MNMWTDDYFKEQAKFNDALRRFEDFINLNIPDAIEEHTNEFLNDCMDFTIKLRKYTEFISAIHEIDKGFFDEK